MVARHSGRKDWPREREWPAKSLDLEPPEPQFPHLSSGSPPSAGVTPRSHQSVTAAVLGGQAGSRRPERAQGQALSDCSPFPSPGVGGFLWLLSPNRKPWSGEVPISCSCSPARPGLRPSHMLGGGAWAGKQGGCSEGKGKQPAQVGGGLEAPMGSLSIFWVCSGGC